MTRATAPPGGPGLPPPGNRTPCRAGDTEGRFIRLLERGERRVARVPLPDDAVRRPATGHHTGRPGDDFAWPAEFAPPP